MKRFWSVILLMLMGAIAFPNQVLAECVGPSLSVSALTVPVDGELVVTGQFFGTKCNDSGPPPIGEGVLGLPLQDIEIVMTQSDATILVAQGNAGNDFDFAVRVKLPVKFTTGVVKVTARYGVSDPIDFSELTFPYDIVVTEADVASETMERGTVASFGPAISEKIYEQTFNRATYTWFFISVILFGMWYRLSRKRIH